MDTFIVCRETGEVQDLLPTAKVATFGPASDWYKLPDRIDTFGPAFGDVFATDPDQEGYFYDEGSEAETDLYDRRVINAGRAAADRRLRFIRSNKNNEKEEKAVRPSWAGAQQKVRITAFKRDVVIKRTVGNKRAKDGMQKRGMITAFSTGSLKRMKHTARNIDLGASPGMITLTYPATYPTDGREVKRHWQRMQQWLKYRGISGFWFLEFQERGAPHIHVFVDGWVPWRDLRKHWIKVIKPKPEEYEDAWAASTKVEEIRSPQNCLNSYATKYASKMEQKEVPESYHNVGRFWGCFGSVKPAVTLDLSATLSELSPIVRLLRKMETVKRKAWGGVKREYSAYVGFTAYDCAPALTTNWDNDKTCGAHRPFRYPRPKKRSKWPKKRPKASVG